ncbi:MAG: hypothetical protein DRZ90_05280 [Spirochaetes bacterium]|nr:MAG: hypothetical protein DRZ90_05280 [Spirochaetota bacterium]
MKKLLLIICFGFVLIASAAAGQEGESWARLYRRIPDLKQKYSIMQNIAVLDDRGLEPFLLTSLNELVYGELSQYRRDKSTFSDWELLTRLIVKELGDIKAQSAVTAIWDIVETAEVPLLKAEGLIALGNIRALNYTPEIAMILRNLNFNTSDDRDAAEIVAYAAVTALGKMKDDVGFEPVFDASIGWYSDRVSDLAALELNTMSGNPALQLVEIIEGNPDYKYKRYALETALSLDVSDSEKTSASVAALSEGLKYSENDYELNLQLTKLRIDAITSLITLGAATPESPRLLDKAIKEGDIDEKLIAIQALGVDGSDEAATILAGRLSDFNERQASGISLDNEELLLVKQLMFALGVSGNQIGIQPLKEMSFVGYTPALLRKADEAMSKIGGN